MTTLFHKEETTETVEKISNPSWIEISLLVLMAISVGVLSGTYFAARMGTAPANGSTSAAATTGNATKDKDAGKPADVSPVADIDITGKGGGVERPLIRQLVATPSLCEHTKKCKPLPSGDRNDPKKVLRWAGNQAHLLASESGLYDWRHGLMMRVKHRTTAFKIEKDPAGDLTIAEYDLSKANAGSASSYTRTTAFSVASSVAASHFMVAAPDKHLHFQTPHLYLYTGIG